MDERTLTTTEAAEALGVPKGTLKTWLERLPVPVENDSRGRRRIPQRGLDAIAVIKAMRETDAGFETIRRRLEPIHEQHYVGAASAVADPSVVTDLAVADTQPSPGPATIDSHAIASIVAEAVINAVRGDNELVRMYGAMSEQVAKAAHRIGELEATNKALDADRERLSSELARSATHLSEAREQIKLLVASPARTWWRIWG